MSFLPADGDRHVVPRWRPSHSRLGALEMASIRPSLPPESPEDSDFIAREVDFKFTPGVWTAADLVSAAVSRGISNSLVYEAADLLNTSEYGSPALRKVLAGLNDSAGLEVDTVPLALAELNHDFSRRVKSLREMLRVSPRNAMRWLDLALAHLTLGNLPAAHRSIHSALTIAPRNRAVLRSSSRFFIHTGHTDEALFWLERSDRLESDPWLLAAHIAVSQVAGSPLTHFRTARSMLTDGSIAPFSASELFAVVASEELNSGRARPARIMMSSALREPTENAVAQAVWSLDRGLSGFEIDRAAVPRAYEAETLAAMQLSDWEAALTAVESWLSDEPFSVRAALHASYIALTGLEEYEKALGFIRLGLRTSPDHPMLLNNGAFAFANLNRTVEANDYLDRAITDDMLTRSMLLATRGLTRFREGEVGVGRELYRQATENFKKDGGGDLVGLCQVMWAREEMRANTEVGDRLFAETAALIQNGESSGARVWLERIRRQLRTARR